MKSAILIHFTHACYKIGNIKSTIAIFCTNNLTGLNDSSGRDPMRESCLLTSIHPLYELKTIIIILIIVYTSVYYVYFCNIRICCKKVSFCISQNCVCSVQMTIRVCMCLLSSPFSTRNFAEGPFGK